MIRVRRAAPALAILAVIASAVAPSAARPRAAGDEAACAPETLVKVVVADASPQARGTFAAQPKTIWRSGSLLLRLEEELDAAEGLHQVFIVNGRDVWVANLADMTGRHAIDREETPGARAAVVTSMEDPTARTMEYGCELAWAEAHPKGPPTEAVRDGAAVLRHETHGPGVRLVLDVDAATRRPVALVASMKGQPDVHLKYLAHESGLPPDPRLFERPAGVAFLEDDLDTAEELGALLEGWLDRPRPELVPAAIAVLSHAPAEMRTTGAAAFLATLLARDAARRAEWSALLATRRGEARAWFARVESGAALPPARLASPDDNDAAWGAWLADGDPAHLERLVAASMALDERADLSRFLAASSAAWSLSANARRHPRVRKFLEARADAAEEAERRHLRRILSAPPESFRDDAVRIVREGRAAGAW